VNALEELVILIPSHSLEDFPSDLPEEEAAGLLNGFQILWDPRLLVASGTFPNWQRADEIPDVAPGRLIVVPQTCEYLLPAGWIARAKSSEMILIHGESQRAPMLEMALAGLDSLKTESQDTEINLDVADRLSGDFYALAFCYLQLQLLARHMRHFSNLDEAHFQHETLLAAESAVAGDEAKATKHLKNCFEVLTEARERFYPVDSYLIDLWLTDEKKIDELEDALKVSSSVSEQISLKGEQDAVLNDSDIPSAPVNSDNVPVNLLITGELMDRIGCERKAVSELIRGLVDKGSLELCGGPWQETDMTLLPLESVIWQFNRGRQAYQKHLGRSPEIYCQRRFGLMAQLPQILKQAGFTGAIHCALDDGKFPNARQAKIHWEGRDGTVIDALTKIPMSAETATTYLNFPERLAQTMDHDHVATLVFAHWPKVQAPWYEDLRRTSRYAPVFGRFVSLGEYFRITDTPGQRTQFKTSAYRSSHLVQNVAAHQPAPITRYRRHERLRLILEESWWMTISADLNGNPEKILDFLQLESRLEALVPRDSRTIPSEPGEWPQMEQEIESSHQSAKQRLTESILDQDSGTEGYLIINALSFSRKIPLQLPGVSVFSKEYPILSSQIHQEDAYLVVEVPAMGYCWLPVRPAEESTPETIAQGKKTRREKTQLLAEEGVVRNEFFEAYVDDKTGGLRGIMDYKTASNRLGQQLCFCKTSASRPETFSEVLEQDDLLYSKMVADSAEVVSSGPTFGEIVTRGSLCDQKTGKSLAKFRQRFRAWRGRPVLEVQFTVDPIEMPDSDPWEAYYAARFAWPDQESALVCNKHWGADVTTTSELESTHYIEIGIKQSRTTVLCDHFPFHRMDGDHRLDTLLVCQGESEVSGCLGIVLDARNPLHDALDLIHNPITAHVAQGRPRSDDRGWFVQLDASNVIISSVRPLAAVSNVLGANDSESACGLDSKSGGMRLRLVETEGRTVRAHLRFWKNPKSAKLVDLAGKTLSELVVQEDTVLVDLAGHEMITLDVLS